MNESAQNSKLLPLTGERPLNAKEKVKRSQALARNLPEKNKPSCTGQAFLGVFFDGTGNNRDDDLGFHKQSNIVRLWRSHLDNSNETTVAPPAYYRAEYIPGVGTPFPIIGESRESSLKSYFQGKSGKGMANGGQSRIFWGLIQTINVMHRYVMSGKPLLTDVDAGKFAESKSDGFPEYAIAKLKPYVVQLKEILINSKPKVIQFNISVFGFSRGAAEARAFCTWFYQLCEKSGDDYIFAGIPVHIYFLGIFDTVAAVGATNGDVFKDEIASGHAAWAKGTLKIPIAIDRCVHFVASHEVRASFPLDSVRYMGKYPTNCIEIVYPGVHSDVGGGYTPLCQGRSGLPADGISYSFSALIPCIDMHKEAIATGVPLKTIQQMNPEGARDFRASRQTVDEYNAYIKEDSASGSVEEILKQRMNKYRLYRYKYIETFIENAEFQGAPREDLRYLKITNNDFKEKCAEFKKKYANVATIMKKEQFNRLANIGGKQQTIEEQKKELLLKSFNHEDLEMWEGMHRVGELSTAVVNYFDNYLHDSIAGFAQDGVREYQYNGRGHFRPRTVYDKGGFGL
ncbi:hypothetical protein AAKU55_005431 [Oxalobacteraceae bacterium GrIS 1.11]